MFDYLNYRVFTLKSKETKCSVLISNFERSEKRYNETTNPMSGNQGQLKVQDLLRKCDTDLSQKFALDN